MVDGRGRLRPPFFPDKKSRAGLSDLTSSSDTWWPVSQGSSALMILETPPQSNVWSCPEECPHASQGT